MKVTKRITFVIRIEEPCEACDGKGLQDAPHCATCGAHLTADDLAKIAAVLDPANIAKLAKTIITEEGR